MTAVLASAKIWNDVVYYTVISTGAATLAVWLLRTSLGRTALAGSKPRRHAMPWFAPLVALFVWLAGAILAKSFIVLAAGAATGERDSIQNSLAYSIGAIPFVLFVLLLGHFFYARGVKGLGLRLRTIPKALAMAALYLLAVMPLVMAVLAVIEFVGKAVQGQNYQIPQHEKLQELSQWPELTVRLLVILTAVIIAPLQEEMLFRGVFQTFIRSYVVRPWLAVAITSVLFAFVHSDQSHWPALFVLALGLGYSYERSGSLWQPIFMHALFNGVVIVSALTG